MFFFSFNKDKKISFMLNFLVKEEFYYINYLNESKMSVSECVLLT